jgi:hypothetical protein
MPGNKTLKLPTPICPGKLKVYLHAINYDYSGYLIDGFSNGFSLNFTGTPPISQGYTSNHQSFNDNLAFGRSKILEECRLARTAGPFDSVPFDNFIIYPFFSP